MKNKIIEANIVNEYRNDCGLYSIEVNRQRMVPDIKDGMKPVLRKILYAMYNDRHCISKTVKCAAIVGDTMANYHPHGDSSIYNVLADACNWFKTKVPYCVPQGNLGTIQGDPPSAYRYTEARLSEFTMDVVMKDLKEHKNTVDWIKNFDGSIFEPEFLPVSIPILLINGNFGIGVGLKSDIPKHNLAEVIDATINLIKHPNAQVILIPDHCMPVQIIDTNWKVICNKGIGNYTARGIVDIEYIKSQDRYNLVIKSIPDFVSLPNILDNIDDMVKNKTLQLVKDVYDESSETELRVIIPLKKGVDPNFTREYLYKNTRLQNSYSINFEVLDGIKLLRMSYKSYLEAFIEIRKLTKFRLYCNKLQMIKTEYHEKEAFIKMMQSKEYNRIIKMIATNKKVSNDNELMEYLIKELSITDLQAKHIMNASLKSLSPSNLARYLERAKYLLDGMNYYFNRIQDDNLILQDIVEELEFVKKKYGQPRTSTIISVNDINQIPKGDFKIIISRDNYIKKVPKEFSIGSFKGNDKPKHVISGCNTQSLLLFDENGRVFCLPIHKISQTDKSSVGIDIKTLIKHATGNIIKVIYEPDLIKASKMIQKHYLITVTESGIIKKMDLEDFINIPMSGIFYTKCEGDKSVHVDIYHHNLDICVTKDNKALRFSIDNIPLLKRNAKGVKSIDKGTVNKVNYLFKDTQQALVVTEFGFVNRIIGNAIPRTDRNKKGTTIIRLESGDKINCILPIKNQTSLIVKSNQGVNEVSIDSIPDGSTASKGTKILPVKSAVILSAHLI